MSSPSLTKYKHGSLKELIAISLPLMISSFSVMLMLFIDRLFLSRYSLEAFNACTSAATFSWAFIMGFSSIAAISEVFVAQKNGAGKLSELGKPVWQMIWFSFFSFLFFVPMAIWGGNLVFGRGGVHFLEKTYFQWIMLFGPFFAMTGAIAGFYIGRGRVREITLLAIFGNLVNIVLDWLLIFGLPGWVPSLGIEGAAIATSIGEFLQLSILFILFFRKKNRSLYGTGNWKLEMVSFFNCLQIGVPAAIFITIEILGYAIYYLFLGGLGEEYITVGSVCQSFLILFFFTVEGVNKGVTSLVGNFIGAKETKFIRQVIRSGMKIHFWISLCLFGVLFFFPGQVMQLLLPPTVVEGLLEKVYEPLKISLFLSVIFLFGEGIRLVYAGVLTAAGDTKYLMVVGSLAIWLFLVAPVHIFLVRLSGPIELGMFLCLFYTICASVLYAARFYSGKWMNIRIEKPSIEVNS